MKRDSHADRARSRAARTRWAAIWMPAVSTAALIGSPRSAVGAQGGDHRATTALDRDVDTSIAPGDDFFGYANGGWLKRTAIPAGMDRWTARTEIDAVTRQRIQALLEDIATAPARSLARKVADFRAAFLDEAAIEQRGTAPLKPVFASIDRIRDRAALTRLLGRWLPTDVDPLNWGVYRSSHLLGLSVEPGTHGEKTSIALLVQGGLGLPDREPYLSTAPAAQVLRVRYREYIARQLTQAGFDHAEQRAQDVMALETAIARTQASSQASANDRNVDNRWTRADFARNAPGMDWSLFFAAAGLGRQQVFVAWQPSAVTGVAALVRSQPLQRWKDYLRFHLLDRYADLLPHAFAGPALAFHASETGRSAPASRAERALAATQLAMGEALGRLYAERYFPPDQKARIEAIEANVLGALVRRIHAIQWMSPGTKTVALAKLKTLYFGIGYPDHWQDYADLSVDPRDAIGNLRRAGDRDRRHAIARLDQPPDMASWWILPQTVGAVLTFQQNAYNFPAALLQAPKFDPEASDAANYGAIGAIIGHELSHFVDLLGADWDAEGRASRWWTTDDTLRFHAAVEPLVRQFSGYQPFPDLAVNGARTRTESIADLAGLVAAFDAYRRTLGSRATDSTYLRQRDREFFIGFARSWRSKLRDEALRTQVMSDSHAPDRFRIATVRNLDAWYDAFHVVPGQKLYLEPAARVRIW